MTSKIINPPTERHFKKVNNQNLFNQKIKPRIGCFRENDYRMENYFNKNANNNNISNMTHRNKITKIMLIQDPNQTQTNNNVSSLYKKDKKIKNEIKIENKKLLDDISQNMKDANNANNSNKKILNRPKSSMKINNNNHYNKINNENNKKRFIRPKSTIIIRNNISKKQSTKVCFNIIDKLLKMISNIPDIKNYFSNRKNEVIKKCIDANKNGLTHILYLINNDLPSENELNKFVENFIKQNSLDENGELSDSDIKYVEPIINYIYNKINNELTKIKQTENNPIRIKFYNDNPSLECMKKHNSIISDLFLGIFHKEVKCQAHQEEICKNEIFYFIDFDLKEIHDIVSDIKKMTLHLLPLLILIFVSTIIYA